MRAPILEFPELAGYPVRAAMTLRVPGVPISTDRDKVLRDLNPAIEAAADLVAPGRCLIMAEQTHGNEVALIGAQLPLGPVPVVDGLLTDRNDVVLGIAVADCCPVWLWTPDGGAVAVVHAGRKGAEAGIAAVAARMLSEKCGCPLSALGAFLGPCIRPPHYEVDIPRLLHDQLDEAGVRLRLDCGLDTAADLARFYSYRTEKGRTGRMMAFGWRKG